MSAAAALKLSQSSCYTSSQQFLKGGLPGVPASFCPRPFQQSYRAALARLQAPAQPDFAEVVLPATTARVAEVVPHSAAGRQLLELSKNAALLPAEVVDGLLEELDRYLEAEVAKFQRLQAETSGCAPIGQALQGLARLQECLDLFHELSQNQVSALVVEGDRLIVAARQGLRSSM